MTDALAERAARPWPGDAATGSPGAGRAVAGAGPKGRAIAAAALRLFLRDGYERTSVDAIAAEAGVSKRTIYSRYGDKENLFLSVLREYYLAMMATFAEIAEAHLGEARLAEGARDVQQDLAAFVREVTARVTTAPGRTALVRLILAEAPFFPALVRQEMGPQTMHGTIERGLARLAAAGRLDISDPGEAAEHLLALTTNQINARTLFGIVPMSDAGLDRLITGGVAAFVRAYRPA
ncbi:MAG TPA: TetR/AcrR family transcriptional regulator [Streptosporangiaceae bacterium]|nr:TetR/AcrR family transcriptional regulator [Streptosporangiaceae bacterium]